MSMSKQNLWTAFEILDIPLRYVLEILEVVSEKERHYSDTIKLYTLFHWMKDFPWQHCEAW